MTGSGRAGGRYGTFRDTAVKTDYCLYVLGATLALSGLLEPCVCVCWAGVVSLYSERDV